jgi:signal transduction histidine kinase
MSAEFSPALRVLIIGNVPGDAWLLARLTQLAPPACIDRTDHVETADGQHDLIIVPLAEADRAARRWPDSLVCESYVPEDDCPHLSALDPQKQPLAHLIEEYLCATENGRLLDETRRQHRLAETLGRVSRLASALLDVEQVSTTILRELEQLIELDAGLIALYEERKFRVVHQIGHSTQELEWLAGKSPILYRVMHQQAPVWINHTAEDRVWKEVLRDYPTRSWIGVPLLSRDQTIGVLAVARFVPHAYRQMDVDILLALANQVAGVVDNAQLLEQSEQREREARALYEITHLLVTFDPISIPASVLRELREALPFDAAGMLVVGETDRVVITAQRGVTETALQALEDRLYNAFNALSQEPIQPGAVQRQVLRMGFPASGEWLDDLPAHLSALLLVGRRVVGVIELCKADPEPYTETQLRTLYTIANSTANALENARLYQSLVTRAINLEQVVDELAAADRLKDELVGNVSHELRSPLTYVMGYVGLLLADEMGALTPAQRESLEIVAAKAKMLARLVADILSFEKDHADDLVLAPANLATIAQQVVKDMQPSASEARIQLVTAFDPSVNPVMADAGRIEQVLNNLLGNALKFTPAEGTITVRILARGSDVRAEVEDTGIGIPADKLSRVFDRFYQVDMESRRRHGGVGLGLAICKQIIEAHGGRIGVTSQPGVGSVFYFELPSFGSERSANVDRAEDRPGDHG